VIEPHKITVEITLPHKRFCYLDKHHGAVEVCRDCQCANQDYENGMNCNLGYFEETDTREMVGYIHPDTGEIKGSKRLSPGELQGAGWVFGYLRPQKCIEDHG